MTKPDPISIVLDELQIYYGEFLNRADESYSQMVAERIVKALDLGWRPPEEAILHAMHETGYISLEHGSEGVIALARQFAASLASKLSETD